MYKYIPRWTRALFSASKKGLEKARKTDPAGLYFSGKKGRFESCVKCQRPDGISRLPAACDQCHAHPLRVCTRPLPSYKVCLGSPKFGVLSRIKSYLLPSKIV